MIARNSTAHGPFSIVGGLPASHRTSRLSHLSTLQMVLTRRQNIWCYTAQHTTRRGGSHGQISTIKVTQDAYWASWRRSGRWPVPLTGNEREREREELNSLPRTVSAERRTAWHRRRPWAADIRCQRRKCLRSSELVLSWQFHSWGSWQRAAAQHNTTAHSSPDIYITNDKYSAFHYFKPQPRFRNSYLAGSRDGFVENFFLGYRIICLVKLTASTMLYSIKRQYSSVPPLLRHCLPVLMKFVELQRKLYFFSSGWHW